MKLQTDSSQPLVQSVLHPTDFSAASNRAFAHALAIALLRQTELTILHVGPESESEIKWSRFPPVRKTLERWGLLDAGSEQSDVFKALQVRVRKLAIKSRNPGNAIAQYSETNPSDLTVLATEGRQGVARWLERSDAESMAQRTNSMTLFVPESVERGIVSLEDGDIQLNKVLVPVDRQPDPGAALEFARRAADVLGDGDTEILLLHVGDEPPGVEHLPEGDRWTWRRLSAKGEPADEIIRAAEREKADLIIMATAGHDGILDALRGSTTDKVLRRSPCPLLAVPINRLSAGI